MSEDLSEPGTDATAPPETQSTLTRIEWVALMTEHNLADGHARQGTTGGLGEVIDRLPSIYRAAEANLQDDVQNDFEHLFFRAAGQPSVLERRAKPLHHYSSSMSIEIVANHLRTERLRVGLLNPTFDNIPDILKRHGVPLVPVPETVFSEPEALGCWDSFDALFLVVPNNPTGCDPGPGALERIALECRRRGVLLIIDFSFRFFSDGLDTLDTYAFFERNDVDHIGIEDVGKVWPMLDLKLGSLVAGPRRHDALRVITDDMILNVSPFVFALITDAGRSGAVRDARSASVLNRAALVKELDGGPVTVMEGGSAMSVAWLRLPEGWDSGEVCGWLQKRGIAVLPGRPFFWADQEQGARYLRIALMRPVASFESSVKALADALARYGGPAPATGR